MELASQNRNSFNCSIANQNSSNMLPFCNQTEAAELNAHSKLEKRKAKNMNYPQVAIALAVL